MLKQKDKQPQHLEGHAKHRAVSVTIYSLRPSVQVAQYHLQHVRNVRIVHLDFRWPVHGSYGMRKLASISIRTITT